MAQFGQYRVYLLDWNAAKVTQLFPGQDFLSINWQHRRNNYGAYTLNLVAETATKDRFFKHYQVLIERNYGDDPTKWVEEYVGFHLGQREWWLTDQEVDEHYWSSIGRSAEWLLTQPQLQPQVNQGNDAWEYYDRWANHGYSDDVIKSMVGENLTSPVDTDRTYTQVVTQGDTGEAIWGCYEGRWVRLSDAIVETIGEDGSRGGCDFRVERVTGGYQFKTYIPFAGTDRRRGNPTGVKPLVFSIENKNIHNPDHITLWGEAVTAAYGGWMGGGMQQPIYQETNDAALAASPFARREGYYDLKDTISQSDVISNYLQQKLIDDGEQEFVNAVISQTNACLYGRDWFHGDLANLDLPDGSSHSVRIIEVNASVNSDKEEQIEGVIELWTRS